MTRLDRSSKSPKSTKRSPGDFLGRYAYFSGIGFQMVAVIGAFTYLGHWIDGARGADTPVWTAVLALVGVCLSIYTTIRMVTRKR